VLGHQRIARFKKSCLLSGILHGPHEALWGPSEGLLGVTSCSCSQESNCSVVCFSFSLAIAKRMLTLVFLVFKIAAQYHFWFNKISRSR